MRALGIITVLAAAAVAAGGCGGEGKVALPAGFPGDLPVIPGAVLQTAQDLGPRGLNLVFACPGGAEQAAGEQRALMEAADWVLVAEVQVERGRVGSWRKDGRSAAVAVAAGPDGTRLSVGYQAPRASGDDRGSE